MKPVLVVAVLLSLFIFSECYYITILDRSTLRKVKKFSKDCVEMRRFTGTCFFRSRRKRRRVRETLMSDTGIERFKILIHRKLSI